MSEKYLKELGLDLSDPIIANVSNRHIHITQEHLDILFGKGYKLNKLKDLMQTGEYASKETVSLVTKSGILPNVRILGPVRANTQIEISRTDSFTLKIKAPIRVSGNVQNSPGATLVGPNGSVYLKEGVIIAARHIHMTEKDANKFGVTDKEKVFVYFPGSREGLLGEVLVRVKNSFVLEAHFDNDEANGMNLSNGQNIYIVKKSDKTEEAIVKEKRVISEADVRLAIKTNFKIPIFPETIITSLAKELGIKNKVFINKK